MGYLVLAAVFAKGRHRPERLPESHAPGRLRCVVLLRNQRRRQKKPPKHIRRLRGLSETTLAVRIELIRPITRTSSRRSGIETETVYLLIQLHQVVHDRAHKRMANYPMSGQT